MSSSFIVPGYFCQQTDRRQMTVSYCLCLSSLCVRYIYMRHVLQANRHLKVPMCEILLPYV
jgi:hypothetical protein